MAGHVGATPANVSQHLAKLRLARLVRTRRVGNRIYYRAGDTHVRHLVEEALFHTGHLGQDPAHPVTAAHAGTEGDSARPSRPA